MNSAPLFSIVGGTLTGNHGAEGMLRVVIRELQSRYPNCSINILTYYPLEDGRLKLPSNCRIYSATPLRLCVDWLPTAIVRKVLSVVFPHLKPGLPFSKVLQSDALIDIAGVSFIDGREKFLPYNVLTLYPFLLNKVPVVKLSQAIGPITSIRNRFAAGLVLPKLEKVFARGATTLENIRQYSTSKVSVAFASDLAFRLEYSDQERQPRRIGLVPSSLLMSRNARYVDDMAELANWAICKGFRIKLIAHSWRAGSTGSRNNDTVATRAIYAKIENKEAADILGEGLFARELKEEIARCELVVSSRFHGMVAALSTKTPVVVLGWSHKYAEVMAQFSIENLCIPYSPGKTDEIKTLMLKAIGDRAGIEKRIGDDLPMIRESSASQFAVLDSIVNYGNRTRRS